MDPKQIQTVGVDTVKLLTINNSKEKTKSDEASTR